MNPLLSHRPSAFHSGSVASLGVGACALLISISLAAQPFTETTAEFHGRGDFDGDGREDLVIVDRTTGTFRIGYQLAAGTFSWAEARASGVTGVTGLAVGRVLSTTRDALVLTSPEANRVQVLGAASPALPETPVSWHPPSVGPVLVASLDIGGPGNTAHDDLFAVTTWNPAPDSVQQALARSTGAALAPLGSGAAPTSFVRGGRVLLKDGAPAMLGLVNGAASPEFRVYQLTAGLLAPVATATGLPAEARYVSHRFGAGAWHQFLFYRVGTSNLQGRAVQEPVPGTYAFGAAVMFDLGRAVTSVQVLPGTGGGRLLVLFDQGAAATVFDFDGANPPTPVRTWTAAPGERFTGAGALGGFGLMLHSGSSTDGRSMRFAVHLWDGSQYVAGASGELPTDGPQAATANVFVFRTEPFVTPNPVLVQRLSAGDWTSQPTLPGAPPQIQVIAETYGGSAAGLGSPTSVSLGAVTPPGTVALANQVRSDLSLFSLLPAIGDEVVEVQIAPPPGPQSTTVQVSLTASVAGSALRYRLGTAAPWQLYGGPFVVFRDTTLQYYAQAPASDRKSVVRTAVYTFDQPPSALDSDNDGVPDFVELGLDANNNGTPDYQELGQGVDPVVSGKDSDGDGYSDLEEVIRGSNPYLASSVPAGNNRLEDRSGFDVLATPRPLDGTVPAPGHVRTGVQVRLHALQGTLLRFNAARLLAAPAPAGQPTAALTNVPVDIKDRLLVLATEMHYPIQTAGPDPDLGREMLGLISVPSFSAGFEVPYVLGNGPLAAEAAAWRTAAQAAAAAQPRVRLTRTLSPQDTLAALLFERKIELLLQERGLDPTNQISLFSFRTADLGRHVPLATDLLGLEREADGHSAHLLVSVHDGISNALANPPGIPVQRLRELGTEVYRISSISNNAAPGAYPLPVDVLREFLRSGLLHSNYLAQTSMDAAQRAAAAAGVTEVLGLAQTRPRVTLELSVGAPTAAGCTTLYEGVDPHSLVFPDGTAFLFPASFVLPMGSLIEVTGHPDVVALGCPGDGLEVITARVLSVPEVPVVDSDGDLLPDAYECVFFGSLAAQPYDDDDGDGFSNLQELLDGTDPKDALAKGVVPVPLSPPVLDLTLKLNGSLGMKWVFPAAYAPYFNFRVRTASVLGEAAVDLPAMVVPAGGNEFEVQLPPPAGGTQFYWLVLQLK